MHFPIAPSLWGLDESEPHSALHFLLHALRITELTVLTGAEPEALKTGSPPGQQSSGAALLLLLCLALCPQGHNCLLHPGS